MTCCVLEELDAWLTDEAKAELGRAPGALPLDGHELAERFLRPLASPGGPFGEETIAEHAAEAYARDKEELPALLAHRVSLLGGYGPQDLGSPINWFIFNLSRFLGGVFYPISVLPGWCQSLAKLLPITHSLEGIRLSLIQGHSLTQLREQVLALLIFNIVLLPLSIVIFNLAFKIARRDGTLCHY